MGDLGCADDPTPPIADGRDHEGDLHNAAVLSSPLGLEALDVLAAADALEDALHLLGATRRRNRFDRPPDHLSGAIAENPFRAAVPAGHDTVESLSDDRGIGRLHDR